MPPKADDDEPATDAAIWARVRASSPAAVRCRIVFEVEDESGEPVRGTIPVPPPAADAGAAGDAPLRVSRTQREIVEVFLEHEPGNRLKAIQLAKLVGRNVDAIRRPLADLVRQKVLLNHLPDAGYSRGIRFAEVVN